MNRQPLEPLVVIYLHAGSSNADQVRGCLATVPGLEVIEPSTRDPSALVDPRIDLVISEQSAGGHPDLEIIDRVRALSPGLPVIVLTAQGSEQWAVEAMRRGAVDYLSWRDPDCCQRLLVSIAEHTSRSADETAFYKSPGADSSWEQALVMLNVVGFDGYLKRWNPIWQSIFGWSREEIMSRPLGDFVHPEDRARNASARERIYAGESVLGIQARLRTKGGSYRQILWNSVPWVEEQVYFATWQDITDHKLVEQQLRESEERFQLIASATREAVWDWDLRADVVWRNEGFLQTFGAPDDNRDSPVGWWRSRIHPEDVERVLAQIPSPLVGGRQRWLLEYRLRRLDGRYAQVYDRGFTIFSSDGSPVRMVGSIMDISALRNTEEKLRLSEERFRFAAQATSEAIWDWDLSTDHCWRSEGFQIMFGYTADQIRGDFQWWYGHIHPDDRERVRSQIPTLAGQGGDTCEFEYRFRRADGSYADVLDRGFVIRRPDGEAVRMVGSLMDVSARRRAEEMAHMQRAELAHIARVSTMGEIATGLAHELNQPLTAITNYAESCAQALARTPSTDGQLLEWIEKIVHNTHRAGQMIRRLRNFTRKSEPRRSTVEVNELLQEVFDLLEAETRSQNVRVRWEPGGQTHVTVDRIQIQQVLVNLLRNSCEAMSAVDRDERQITVSSTPNHDTVEIAVQDVGEGIPAENRERVFDAFFTSKANGVGIGLAISRSIVEAHGGKLWLSPHDSGVTFHFTLPKSGPYERSRS